MKGLLLEAALRLAPAAWLRRHAAIARGGAEPGARRQLLVDVSLISQADARTGIQRVVRNLFDQLVQAPPAGYEVRAVGATRKAGYRYVDAQGAHGAPVRPQAGDVFLGLDLAARLVHRHAGELFAWKRRGVHLVFVVYDLLPARQPAWFPPGTSRAFRRWLRVVAILAHGVVCISRTVERDFRAWMQEAFALGADGPQSTVIALGADPFGFLGNDAGDAAERLPEASIAEKFVLMVGTLEPRKGHAEVLDAFEPLWARGERTQLVIAGRPGWMVEALVQRVRAHPESGSRLHWLNAPSDPHLLELYQRASGLVMASRGEGLGLPILEALCWNKPVLARDIPIFREVAGDAATYFREGPGEGLAGALPRWLGTLAAERRDVPSGPAVSWRQSRDQLVRALPGGGAAAAEAARSVSSMAPTGPEAPRP